MWTDLLLVDSADLPRPSTLDPFPRPNSHARTCSLRPTLRGIAALMQTDEYLKLAEVEDQMWYFHSLHAHVDRALAGGLGPAKSAAAAAVLDAGCGTGGLILRLREWHPGWRFSGIDFMPIACELARKR